MEYQEIIAEAFSTLSVNKLRTVLATLGIVIGIGSVIALISLGQSSQKSIENQIQSLGANLLTVSPVGPSTGAVRSAGGAGTSLTLADSKAIAANNTLMAKINNISPEFASRSQITAGRNNTNTQVIGVFPQYTQVHKISIASGIFISNRDIDAMAKVAVLGPQVVSDLFGENSDPIGKTVKTRGQTLTVIGVTAAKGGSGFNNPDDAIYTPLTTAQKQLFGENFLTSIAIEAKNPEVMTEVQNGVGYFLLSRHKLKDPSQADFMIFSQNDILDTVSSVTNTFTMLLGGIAAISLLVGGIGIMNIMLVTVTERTREIGLRKALGAKKKIIITQFLVEAITLTLVGGLIGMAGGIATSLGFSKLLNIPFTISPGAVILALTVSGGIGILFGWYPAQKAAGLQPIEALRYE